MYWCLSICLFILVFLIKNSLLFRLPDEFFQCRLSCFLSPMPQNGTELFFRGQLIWEAIKDELLSIGLSNAKQVLELPLALSLASFSEHIDCYGFQSWFLLCIYNIRLNYILSSNSYSQTNSALDSIIPTHLQRFFPNQFKCNSMNFG